MGSLRVAVVGGGIIGLAVADQLLSRCPGAEVTVLEKEPGLARHQTGRNSGVAHAGLYYQPGSLKARLCRRGVSLLEELCAEHGVAYQACGKLLVALDDADAARLAAIRERAEANGVPGVRWVPAAELTEIEPHVRGVAGLHSPTTAIVDFAAVAAALARRIANQGGAVRQSVGVQEIRQSTDDVTLVTDAGGPERYDWAVLCGGLQSDRLGRLAGGGPDPRIVPFRGEYHLLTPPARHLVRGLIYPVPDPRYPFLGVHFTLRVDGEVLAGPNAVLSLNREAYATRRPVLRDAAATLAYPGFWRMARHHWRTGISEVAGSTSRRVFVHRLRRYIPALTIDEVAAGPVGIRAQAVGRDGGLVDDFRIESLGRVVAIRNAPSPGATAALAIAEHICDQLPPARPFTDV